MRGAQYVSAAQAADRGAGFGLAHREILAVTEELVALELQPRLPVVAEPLAPLHAVRAAVRAQLRRLRLVDRARRADRHAILSAGLVNGLSSARRTSRATLAGSRSSGSP